ncbi:trafficking protein particle complex subunit 13-like isoform X2 [Anneissia japonica]|uniref:trafficking protein particle complex subunit 13-like isoform X2 n=1 Tax=Anneissia japonica TaxID=1529436 RepID=UPI0014257E59|nr:trafficking protein particle complex subunit 13-like isoform X2 [Anneissia japonica]
MEGSGGREKEHLLSLKVMRLTKPSFIGLTPVLCEANDIAGGDTLTDIKPSLASVKSIPSFSVSEMLTLPQNFGSIYLGETFSSYVNVHNDSQSTVSDIQVKTDLQTASQRLTLSSTTTPNNGDLEPDGSVDDVVNHEVKELGTHILVCAVSYAAPSGEKMYFRKFFKFQVLKPLDVKTKFYNAEDFVSDEVYLEAQIQNITNSPMCMEKVNLEPSPKYNVRELNTVERTQSNETTFGKLNYLNPMDVRQYLYCLTAKQHPGALKVILKGVSNIGKLDIVWRTNLGERGRLQTSQLERVAPGYGDVRLAINEVPDGVQIEKPFNFKCQITSCCDRTMELRLVLTNTTKGLHWIGVSGKQLGKLGPGASMDIDLTLMASIPGLLSISGLRLTDQYLKRTYEHDDIAQVFVYTSLEGA